MTVINISHPDKNRVILLAYLVCLQMNNVDIPDMENIIQMNDGDFHLSFNGTENFEFPKEGILTEFKQYIKIIKK